MTAPIQPPYKLHFETTQVEQKPKKKSRTTAAHAEGQETITVSTYKVPNMGPYPQDVPKKNAIRFTPIQGKYIHETLGDLVAKHVVMVVESIHSGMNHGLTMVVGPPGTGKTDVAVQTIANLYHNNPTQHTLIVTHSNQALNQIFEKLTKLGKCTHHSFVYICTDCIV